MEVEIEKFSKKNLQKSLIWINDKEICRLFLREHSFFSLENQREWFEKIKKDKKQMIFAISVDGVYIGNIGLKNINRKDLLAELFVLIGERDYWGRGIGYIAAKKFLSICKQDFQLRKIFLHVADYNKGAIRLYKKLGFFKEGVLKDELIRKGEKITILRMAYFL